MRVNWTKTSSVTDDKVVYKGRYGLIHMEHVSHPDGNHTYWLYTLSNGRRNTILRVSENPKGPDQINAKERCEWLGAVLDNLMAFDPLPAELLFSSILKLKNKPAPTKSLIVDGITISRVYHYQGPRGNSLYKVFSVMNHTAESYVTMVGYRNIFTGEEYCRPVAEFTPEKYSLMAIGSNIPNPHNFLFKTNK